MRINIKQQQLIDKLFAKVHKKYPEIEFKHLEVSPDDPDHIWIIVEADIDEDKELRMQRYSSGLAADILSDYGYMLSIMSDNPNVVCS